MTIYRMQPHDMPTFRVPEKPHDMPLSMGWYLWEAFKLLLIVAAFLIGWHLTPSWAREGGDWSKVDPEVREWIANVHRPDLYDGHTSSCCGEADVYFADMGEVGEDGKVYAIVTDNRGNPLPVGTRLEVKPDKIQKTEGNPTDHVVVFADGTGHVFCFVPNGGV